jgi:hypothetical protein
MLAPAASAFTPILTSITVRFPLDPSLTSRTAVDPRPVEDLAIIQVCNRGFRNGYLDRRDGARIDARSRIFAIIRIGRKSDPAEIFGVFRAPCIGEYDHPVGLYS